MYYITILPVNPDICISEVISDDMELSCPDEKGAWEKWICSRLVYLVESAKFDWIKIPKSEFIIMSEFLLWISKSISPYNEV